MRLTGIRLISRFGTGMILRMMEASGSSYDPTLTPNDEPCTGVIVNFTKREVDGVRVLRSDKKVFIAADQVIPTTRHRLGIGGEFYSIIEVDTVEPATTTIVYTLQVRK